MVCRFISSLCMITAIQIANAQEEQVVTGPGPAFFFKNGIGVEAQGYLTGVIAAIKYEHGFARSNHAVNVRVGYNLVRHRDLGVQDDERGGGAGLSLGYRYYFYRDSGLYRGFFLGAKTDLWFNKIHWKNSSGTLQETSGTTRIGVFQPTAEAGYCWTVRKSFNITPYLALGAEINVKTKGEAVGQGAIFLAGLSVGYRFK